MRPIFAFPTIVLALSSALTVPGLGQEAKSLPAPASAGTVDGSESLKDALASYVTAVPFDRKFIRVEPDPNGQKITLDPASFLSELAGKPVTFSPLSFVVSERGDGTWNVFTADPVAISAVVDVEGQEQSFDYRQASQVLKGVFSPELAAFLSAEGEIGTTNSSSRDAMSSSTSTINATRMSMSASPANGGAADIAFKQTYDTVKQTTSFQFPTEGDAAPTTVGFEFGAATVISEGAAKTARTRAMLDLYTLAISRAADLQRDAKGTLAGSFGAELKNKLRAVLPLWDSLDGSASAQDIKISSLYGELGVQEASQSVRMSGISSNGSFDLDLALKGITAATPLMPAWGNSFVPDLIEIGFTVSGANLAAPADIALRKADFTKDPPLSPEAQAEVQAAFAPENIRTRIKPSRIRAGDLDVAFSGDVAFPSGIPVATMAIDVAGLDATIATLQSAAATEPSLNQAIGMLQLAKGFSRPKSDGRVEWVIATAADGSVTVNGTMLKAPDDGHGPDDPSDEGLSDETLGNEPPTGDPL
jgi:hypothetical protein